MLLIAAMLIGQMPAWDDEPPVVRAKSPTLADMDFTMAVEESIGAEPGTSPPEPYRTLIRMTGARCWSCREIASKKLQAASAGDMRWLMWGRKSKDMEVRLRCNNILRRLVPCPDCKGTGKSEYVDSYPCWKCQGLRTQWLYSMWDD